MTFFLKLVEMIPLDVLFLWQITGNWSSPVLWMQESKPIWADLQLIVNDKLHADYQLNNFDLMLGFSIIFLCPSYSCVVNL